MKAIGYIRVSTEDQAREGISLAVQKDKIEKYALLKGIELSEIIEDPGISAKNLDRPGIRRLLELIKAGCIENIIIYKLDRLFRSTRDAIETMEKFNKKSIVLHSIVENLDTSSAFGKFMYTLLAAIGQLEREVIGERTRSASMHLKLNDKVYGTIPYGKRRVGDNLVENKEEQDMIAKIVVMYAQLRRYNKVAERLNEAGCTTRNGRRWYPQQVKNIVDDDRIKNDH
jgi:site-specific DNA recombinase